MSHNDTTSNNPITTNPPTKTNNSSNSPTPINPSTSIITNPYNIKDSIYSYLKLSRCEMALLIYMLFQEEREIERNKWIENSELTPLNLKTCFQQVNKITIDVIRLYRLTGMSRSSFYRTFKKLVKKGYIIENKYDIVDQSGSKENKEKYNLV